VRDDRGEEVLETEVRAEEGRDACRAKAVFIRLDGVAGGGQHVQRGGHRRHEKRADECGCVPRPNQLLPQLMRDP